MAIVRRLARLSHSVRYALVGVAAFLVGSATVASASIAGIPIGSLFYLPMINGIATTPCSTATSTLGSTTTCNAVVDANGNLHVTGSSTVTGTVGVNNFPATQNVGGTVNIGNLPGTQAVNGTVNVGNLPGTQAVNGTVNVGNLPADQLIHGSVAISNLPAATGSGGVTLIHLPSQNVSGESFSFARWGPDTSACSKTTVVVSADNHSSPDVRVSGPLVDVDTKQREFNGTKASFLVEPGTNEPWFGPSLDIFAFNTGSSATTMSGDVYCAH
jgi:hypothetical protein